MKELLNEWKQFVNEENKQYKLKDLIDNFEGFGRIIISETPIDSFEPISVEEQDTAAKPRGLWYACGTEWLEWLKYEMPHWAKGEQYLYRIHLDASNMLFLNTEEKVRKFDKSYGEGRAINWQKVAKRFSGIEICPYQRSLRNELSWYYSWDIASGIIWHQNAFDSVEFMFHGEIDPGETRW